MKTLIKLLGIVMTIAFAIPGLAQTDNQKAATSINFNKLGTYVPGKLYFKDGKVEDVEDGVEYQNPEDAKKLDNMLNYNKSNQTARASVSKTKLEAFEVGGNKWVKMTYDGEEQFGILHIDGAIKDFSVFKIPFARVTGDYIEKRFVQKLDEKPISNTSLMMKYKKTIVVLVEDNKELVKKINAKEKGYKGFVNSVKIIEEYNEWHKSQYPDLHM